jgi:hypothetical protein
MNLYIIYIIMIDYIKITYYLLNNLFYVLFFCYLYNPLYIKCNVQKKIKKNGKTKIISQPKSILAYTYLLLLYLLFKCYTIKIVLFLLLLIIIGSLILFDGLSPKLNEYLHKFNKMNFIIFSWKILHTIFTIIYIFTQPIFSIMNNYIYSKFLFGKNIFKQIANFDLANDPKGFEKNIFKMSEEMSNMSDYIFKSNKNESIIKNNELDKKNKIINLSNENEISNENKISTNLSDENYNNDENNDENNENDENNDKNDNEKNSSIETKTSKNDMIKIMNELNQVFDNKTDTIEDITLTEIS